MPMGIRIGWTEPSNWRYFFAFSVFSGKSSKREGSEGVRHARRGKALASHAGVFGGARLSSLPTKAFFRGARLSSLPTNACSTENNIPFPNLAIHTVLWPSPQGNLIITRSAWNTGKAFWPLINVRFRAAKVRFSQILEYVMRCITLAKDSLLSEGKKRRKTVTLGSRFSRV